VIIPGLRRLAPGLLLCAAFVAQPAQAAPRDGAHDFDFDLGRWHTHSTRLMHPLAGAKDWVELDGETNVTPIWGGKGNLAEYKAQGPSGPLELIAIRIYNPKTRQWAINFATPGVGTFGTPSVGEVQDGRMTFTIRRISPAARSGCAFRSGRSTATMRSPKRPFPPTAARVGK